MGCGTTSLQRRRQLLSASAGTRGSPQQQQHKCCAGEAGTQCSVLAVSETLLDCEQQAVRCCSSFRCIGNKAARSACSVSRVCYPASQLSAGAPCQAVAACRVAAVLPLCFSCCWPFAACAGMRACVRLTPSITPPSAMQPSRRDTSTWEARWVNFTALNLWLAMVVLEAL